MADDTRSEATKDERPASRDGGARSSESIVTPEQAMQRFEARRAQVFSAGLAALTAFGAVVPLVLGGDRIARLLHGGLLAATAIVATTHAIYIRDPRRYRTWHIQALAYVAVCANGSGYLYWGPLSAYVAVVPVSAYAFASGTGMRGMWGALVLLVALHVGAGVAQTAHWIDVTSWIVTTMTPFWQMGVVLLMQVILIIAVLAGRDSFRTMRRVLDEHDTAIRALAQRDAQLAEARAQVRDARAPGEGRYTGQLIGRYRIGDLMGRGAMGEVYAATDERDTRCAVKVLAAHLLGDLEALARFHREARVISSLDAPNIVRMIEVAEPDAALPYFAMERLEGRDLGELIHEQPVRELGEVVAVVRAVAAGLDAAHGAGVVHRDLKPANLFAARDGDRTIWKILDFGVSKLSHADATMTTGHLVGTPGYMAPEQARGDDIDRRADVYSLGVVAYRMLTGRPAVMPGDAPAMIHEVVFRMPPRPGSLAKLPPQVEAVLAIALAKSRDDRFATAGELAIALADAATGSASAAIAERAEAILAASPWGRWLRGPGKPRGTTATVSI